MPIRFVDEPTTPVAQPVSKIKFLDAPADVTARRYTTEPTTSSVMPTGSILDLLSLPERGVAALATEQKLSDPNATLLRKPIEYAKEKLEPAEQLHKLTQPFSPNLAGQVLTPQSIVEIVGRTLGDPLTYAGLAAKPVKAAAGLIGKIPTAIGEKLMQPALRISRSVAQKAGKTPVAGRAKIVKTISKEGVESVRGYEKMLDNIEDVISKNEMSIDEMLKKQAEPGALGKRLGLKNDVISMENVYNNVKAKITSGSTGIPASEVDNAIAYIDKQAQAYEKIHGVPQTNATLEQAQKAKQKFYKEGGFKKGPAALSEDPMKRQVNEILGLTIRDEMDKVLPPEFAALNTSTADLIKAKAAIVDAMAKEQTASPFSLSNLILGGGLGGGAAAASGGGGIESVIAALTGLGIKKGITGGHIPSALISTGRAIPQAAGAATRVLPYERMLQRTYESQPSQRR